MNYLLILDVTAFSSEISSVSLRFSLPKNNQIMILGHISSEFASLIKTLSLFLL